MTFCLCTGQDRPSPGSVGESEPPGLTDYLESTPESCPCKTEAGGREELSSTWGDHRGIHFPSDIYIPGAVTSDFTGKCN